MLIEKESGAGHAAGDRVIRHRGKAFRVAFLLLFDQVSSLPEYYTPRSGGMQGPFFNIVEKCADAKRGAHFVCGYCALPRESTCPSGAGHYISEGAAFP